MKKQNDDIVLCNSLLVRILGIIYLGLVLLGVSLMMHDFIKGKYTGSMNIHRNNRHSLYAYYYYMGFFPFY
jgi:hypothetical protein